MQHNAPKPLSAARAVALRLISQLGEHMTAEQQRDFTRVERMLADAERLQNEELLKARQAPISPRSAHYVRPRVR